MQSITPRCTHHGLGSSDFARRYFRNRFFFLFLRLLRCFSSPGSLYIAMYSLCSDWSFSSQVSPFRNPRINRYLLFPVAYRSLSRLSSALSAKASTLCSLYLDLLILAFSIYSVILSAFFCVSFDTTLDVWLNHIWFIFLQCVVFKVHNNNVVLLDEMQSTSMKVLMTFHSVYFILNGDNEIRTRDLLLARQALSQLSYTPINLAATYSPMPSPT